MVIFVVLLFGCSKEKMDYLDETKSTKISSFDIENTYLNSSSNDIIKSLGDPDYIEEVESSPEKYYIYGPKEDKSDLEIGVSNEKISCFLLFTNEYEFNNDTIINQSKDEIVSRYGSNYYLREDTGSNILGYFDKENNYNLEFYLNAEDNVTHLILEIYEDQ